MNSLEPQVEMQPRYVYAQDDEIDLMELFFILWRGKWLLLAFTLVPAFVAYFIIGMMPAIYQVSTSINETNAYQLQPVQPSTLVGGDVYQVASLNVGQLYNSVLAQADSLYVKKSFWEQYSGQPLSGFESGSAELTANEQKFLGFEAGIALSLAGKDDQNPRMATLTLEHEDRQEGVSILKQYLSYVDKIVILKSLDQLKIGLESNLVRLDEDYKGLKAREMIKLDDQIIRLKEAFNLAESLNIVETPYDQVENVESPVLNNRLYLLGTRALGEELKSLEARREKPLEAFVAQLRNMELWKQQMENDLGQVRKNSGAVSAFVVVAPAESSLRPIKPKKMLLFIASIVAAGFISIVLVFVIHGVKSYKSRNIVSG